LIGRGDPARIRALPERGKEGVRVLTNRQSGTVLLVIGVVILFVSMLADPLKIGQSPQFGSRQLAAGIMGAAFAAIGSLIRRKK
jgi:NO-binding membrane sensor protein with MHYT domain